VWGAAVKLITEYLEQAAHFEHLAGMTTDAAFKQQLLEQAERYWKLANDRAIQQGQTPPVRFRPSE
jgi:hypothetical protein